jgi:DNA (cytosine-5)-methyltransferase 1
MRYLSVCSGIEAATVAWHSLGFEPVAFSDIDKFPGAVLQHHYPSVPNWGDMTKFEEWPDAAIDVLVGGTPCQSFSVAGLRKGLDDPRGNLMLTYLAIARRYRPAWVVWENVPGVLSSNGGRDFGTFLGALGELGYGFAYRVLDAQYCGVPQQRRRVFVVGYLGDWRRAAAVLFERESLSGNPAPRRKAREEVAGCLSAGFGTRGPSGEVDGARAGQLIANAITARQHKGVDSDGTTTLVTHTLRGEGFDASEDGTGRGTPLGTVAFDCKAGGNTGMAIGEKAGALRGEGNGGGHAAIAFNLRGRAGGAQAEVSESGQANIRAASGGSSRTYLATSAVRRLTPRECERLQGFPDDYTLIPYRGKPAADGPRYKAIGNSMAVPVMRWIGERIAMVNGIPHASH